MDIPPSVVLDNGINLRECVEKGSLLEINNIYEDSDNLDEEFETKVTINNIGEPVPSFDAYKDVLVPLNDFNEATQRFVKKVIIESGGGAQIDEKCTVSIIYAGYWENENKPFDFNTIHRPLQVDLNDNGLLPGLQMAVRSMLVGEYSMFLLSYEVMYGIMGAPPKIRPKADCIYYIKLIRSILTQPTGDINYNQPNMFVRVNKDVRRHYMSAVQLYYTNNYSGAIRLFKKSINMLHKCRLADEAEQIQQEKLLLKLYLNLGKCYINSKKPLLACTACNEVNYLSNIWNNPKALFINAQALRMIGEFGPATKKLQRAMKLDPNNENMIAEMKLIEAASKAYNYSNLSKFSNNDIVSDTFKSEVKDLLIKFKEDANIQKFTLPKGLRKKEIEFVKDMCKEYNIFCLDNQKSFALDKNVNDSNDKYEPYDFDNFVTDDEPDDCPNI